MGTPWLPLGPGQVASLVRAVDGGLREQDERGAAIEVVLTALVRELRAERTAAVPGAEADADPLVRARRVGMLTGVVGALGKLPGDLLHQVEEARVLVDAAEALSDRRTDEQLAADLLVLWRIVDDLEAARAMTDPEGTGTVLGHLHDEARSAVPERWTARSTLRFLWNLRKARGVVGAVRPGLLRAIPVIGALPATISAHRDMREWTKAVEEHLAPGAAESVRTL